MAGCIGAHHAMTISPGHVCVTSNPAFIHEWLLGALLCKVVRTDDVAYPFAQIS